MTRYTGAPWRSMYLRAPKIVHELADLPSFCRVEEVAKVRLGLKTGNDKFFFVRPVNAVPAATLFSDRSRRIRIRGLGGDWEGDVQSKDLRPAALNPHTLYDDDRRPFAIPAATGHLYLMPRDQAPAAELASYIALAEQRGVHQTELVRANGSPNRWYRQTRTAITAPWVLPYNSAYDYGAWDNPHSAVINGRFVGVEALDGIDSELLGACLNSTFAVVGRLMQGTTTGVEAAFDVGPPAARRIAVPDPRQMAAPNHEHVRDAVDALRRADRMPSAPNDQGGVEPLRRDLDLAVLKSLGYSTGQAAAFAGRTYEQYARWRRSIRSMQTQMEQYRAQMNRSGVSRRADPIRRLGQQIWEELVPGIPVVPASLLQVDEHVVEVDVSSRWRPGPQEPMLEPGRVEGSGGQGLDVGSWAHARYVGMLLDIGFRSPLRLPVTEMRAEQVLAKYDETLARLLNAVTSRAVGYSGADAEAVIENVVGRWHRVCRASGMEQQAPADAP